MRQNFTFTIREGFLASVRMAGLRDGYYKSNGTWFSHLRVEADQVTPEAAIGHPTTWKLQIGMIQKTSTTDKGHAKILFDAPILLVATDVLE